VVLAVPPPTPKQASVAKQPRPLPRGSELLPENIGAWLARQPLTVTTKRNTLKAMRYALSRAVEWRDIPQSPARPKAVEMPPEPQYDACPFESWDEVRNVAAHFKSIRDQALVIFACATGLRPQEWLVLQWRDVDVPNRCLRVHRTLQDGRVEHVANTRGALRTVLLTDLALDALRMLPTPLRREQYVFPGDRNDTIDLRAWSRRRWKNALANATVIYREPYGMRDTFATLNLNDGAPLEWISEQMGHSDIQVTRDHYARWMKTTDYRILDALNQTRAERTGLKADSVAEGAV
jgi:integrase